MTLESSTAAVDVGEGGNVVLDIPLVIPSDADPPPFDAVEKLPVPIVNPSPHYPEIALRAGIEGTVWTRVWVTKEGKVRKVEVLKSDSNLLDQAAIDAAAQWVFTPAVMNNGPVPVWMSIPFKFRIRDGR
jgi:protein TonB